MDLSALAENSRQKIEDAKSAAELESLRIKYLGRESGEITKVLKGLKDMPLEARKAIGPAAQALKTEIETLLHEKLSTLGSSHTMRAVDLTAPGKKFNRGHLHPLSKAEKEIREIFRSMNFSIVDGPEVESDYFNFEALNFPPDHPARDVQDTFWIKQKNAEKLSPKERLLMRTQVTATQIHHLIKHEPPFQILYPGRTYRNESIDSGHEVNFYQAEAMAVGKNLTLANFKFVVENFFQKFFVNKEIEFRYRPSYFPFVEPGLEVDIKLNGKWFEIMGAGMVHPHVFEYAGYNPREWQGFAFGMGLDRLAMIKYGIPDVRLFYSGDLRFIKQF